MIKTGLETSFLFKFKIIKILIAYDNLQLASFKPFRAVIPLIGVLSKCSIQTLDKYADVPELIEDFSL